MVTCHRLTSGSSLYTYLYLVEANTAGFFTQMLVNLLGTQISNTDGVVQSFAARLDTEGNFSISYVEPLPVHCADRDPWKIIAQY